MYFEVYMFAFSTRTFIDVRSVKPRVASTDPEKLKPNFIYHGIEMIICSFPYLLE